MPYTKQELITLYSLQSDEVNQTLAAAGLSVEGEPYTDEQIQTGFDLIRSYFNSGQVSDYAAAAELFKQHQSQQQLEGKPQAKAKKIALGNKPTGQEGSNTQQGDRLNVLELINLATKNCLVKVELVEAIQIMPLCGLLPNQSEFAPNECDRFVLACNLIKKHNKTYEEVAAHFGMVDDFVNGSSTDSDIKASVSSAASNLDQSSNGIVSEVMRYKAKLDASLAPSFYLQHLSDEFGSPEFKAAWHQMESALKAEVVGKSRLRARQMLGEIRAIPPSHSPSNALPIASDNGSTSD